MRHRNSDVIRTRLMFLGMVAALELPLWLHHGDGTPSLRLFTYDAPDESNELVKNGGDALTGVEVRRVPPGSHASFVSTMCVEDEVMLSFEMHFVRLADKDSTERVMVWSDKDWQAGPSGCFPFDSANRNSQRRSARSL